jgi:3-dehydroquinate dehydratase II
MAKILIINGPNLNLLGWREPDVYGSTTLEELEATILSDAKQLGIEVSFFQSNSEGGIIDFLHKEGFSAQGIVINPGAFGHYSYAIRDAIKSVGTRTIEVHISNIYNREEFRQHSVLAPVCEGQISGLGLHVYTLALNWFARALAGNAKKKPKSGRK